MVALSDGRVAEIAAQQGFDCLWLDQEHMGGNYREIENLIRAAKMYDVDTVVRVPKGSYSDLIRPLEIDATAIMVPHLMNLEEAEWVARNTKFQPVGRRPLDGGGIDGAYCQIPLDRYLADANRERVVIVQIEDPEPMEELDAIAKVPGIDMLLFGPGDFSHGLGIPGQFNDPRIEQARIRVAQVARENGKLAGTVGGPSDIPRLREMGYQFLNIGADLIGMTRFFSGLKAEADKALGL
jgi:4-hydroxy-2-oxoheptanedioate aldolase